MSYLHSKHASQTVSFLFFGSWIWIIVSLFLFCLTLHFLTLISKFYLWFVQIINVRCRWVHFLLLNIQHRQLVTIHINSLHSTCLRLCFKMISDNWHRRLFTFSIIYIVTIKIYSLWSLKFWTLMIHPIIEFDILNLFLDVHVVFDLSSYIEVFLLELLNLPLRWHRCICTRAIVSNSHLWRISCDLRW